MQSGPSLNNSLAEFSSSFTKSYPATSIGMRWFGRDESDLCIDFSRKDNPVLVTQILEHCAVNTGSLPSQFFRELTVGRRVECLMALAMGEQEVPFNFPFPCTNCGQEIELELALVDISELQREADLNATVGVEVEGKRCFYRKPCGLDLESWSTMAFGDMQQAATVMINSLALTPELPTSLDSEVIRLVDEAMKEADPLVNFFCRVTCAECNSKNEFLLDLCDIALERLKRLQQQMLVSIHKLASRYHWSEQEIFAVPHWRRKVYLDLIAAGR